MHKRVAVILSGCGVYDGAEIHESVITLLRLDQRGAQVQCFAPNIAQMHVIDHLTGAEMPESRNVLTEAARIARGDVMDVRELKAEQFDALILPGGTVNPDKLRLDGTAVAFVGDFVRSGKPVAAICHGPWTLVEADVVRDRKVTSYPSVRTDLRNAGATVVDEAVCIDGNLITSRSPSDLPAFCEAITEALASSPAQT